jgi:glycerol-3-phosphate dehydrogenase
VLYGALAEGALTADDLLARRTRLSLVDGDAEAARPMAEHALELARELSLTPAT